MNSKTPSVAVVLENSNTDLKRKEQDENGFYGGSKEGELPGLSKEEAQFLRQTVPNIRLNEHGSIEMPLPFRDRQNVPFPDTRRMAYSRIAKRWIC